MEKELKVRGFIQITVKDQEGNVKAEEQFTNLIVDAGKAEVINLLGNIVSPAPFVYLSTGAGDTPAANTDTALETENLTNGFSRAAAVVTRETTNFTNDTLQLVYTRTATNAVTVAEVGVFNDATTGTMLGRRVVGPYPLSATDQFILTYKITII